MNPFPTFYRIALPALLILVCLGCGSAPAVPTAAPVASPTPLASPVGGQTLAPAPSPIPTNTPLPPAADTPQPTETAAPKVFQPPADQNAGYTATAKALKQAWTPTPTRTPWPASAPGLRELAEKRGLFIGGAVQAAFLEEPAYAEALAAQFNILTPEYQLKMCVVWPARDRFDFTASDAIVQFALDHKMRVRGHTLVWTECVPDWILNGKFTVEEGKQLLHQYISSVVGRYKGKIQYWDVLNETLDRSPIWERLIGPDYAALAFQWAHEADPDALLFYNDYEIESVNPKSDRLYTLLKTWLAAGVPVQGVGFQSHFKNAVPVDSLAENIARFNALGLQVHMTEVDYPITPGDPQSAQTQIKVYADLLGVCLKAANCPVFVMWGVTDKYSFLNTPDAPAEPLILDANFQPKPAYAALYQMLGGR